MFFIIWFGPGTIWPNRCSEEIVQEETSFYRSDKSRWIAAVVNNVEENKSLFPIRGYGIGK